MRNMYYIVMILLLTLTSCSSQWHFNRFQKKGGKIKCDLDTIQLIDTLIKDGDTILKVRDSIISVNQVEYVTKWETKYKYKTIKIQEETKQKETKTQEKTKQKEAKEKAKTERKESRQIKWWWLIVSFFIGYLFHFVIRMFGMFKIPFGYN